MCLARRHMYRARREGVLVLDNGKVKGVARNSAIVMDVHLYFCAMISNGGGVEQFDGFNCDVVDGCSADGDDAQMRRIPGVTPMPAPSGAKGGIGGRPALRLAIAD